jgi:hypothetical protein
MRVSVLMLAAFSACSSSGRGEVHTLYRSSAIDASLRVHVASFDTDDGDEYNRGNCDQAASLFAAQPGVTVKYWCEKGEFHK